MYKYIAKIEKNKVVCAAVMFIRDEKYFQKNIDMIEITEDQCLLFSIANEDHNVVEYDKKSNTFTIVNREVK